MIVLSPEGKVQTSGERVAPIARLTDLRGLVVQHSIGTVNLEEVHKRADAAFDSLVEILLEPQQRKTAVGG